MLTLDECKALLKQQKPVLGYYPALNEWLEYKCIDAIYMRTNPETGESYFEIRLRDKSSGYTRDIPGMLTTADGERRYTRQGAPVGYYNYVDAAVIRRDPNTGKLVGTEL